MDNKKITKAVFPVAGMGTRFLPATKANPKEMLPIVDKPLIQFAVEEAIAAGFTELIFITGRNKRAITDHFDKAYELETELELKGENELLKLIKSTLPDNVSCIYIRQNEALGLGHAVLKAKPVIGDEPFAVLLADDLIDAQPYCMEQMVELYTEHECNVLAIENVSEDEVHRYGIVGIEDKNESKATTFVSSIVEKPSPENAPSTLAVVGRYILSANIFDYLESIHQGAEGEIQLTDAISAMLDKESVVTCEYDGIRYDCGSKLGYLQATIEHGLRHPEVGEQFSEWLEALRKESS